MPIIVDPGTLAAFFDRAERHYRMAGVHEHHTVTLASDFSIHRKQGRTPLALIQPDGPPS
jgi:hypothetical protein